MEREVFCPLVNGECKGECVFNNGSSTGCNLNNLVNVINGLDKKLGAIEYAMSDNYTANFKSSLDNIATELKKNNKS